MLPPELLDIIVEYIPNDDLLTLKACASAFRGLNVSARIRLHRRIRIVDSDSSHSSGAAAQNKCQRLLHIFESHPGNFSKLVQILEITEVREYRPPWVPKASASTLPSILSHLVNLRHFSMKGATQPIHWGKLSSLFKTALHKMAPQLKTLYLRGISLNSVDEIHEVVALVAAARNVRQLSLCLNVKEGIPAEALPSFPPDWTSEFETLALGGDHSMLTADFLGPKMNLDFLRILSLANVPYHDVLLFLKELDPDNKIEELSLWFSTLPFFAQFLDLSALTNLRTLRVAADFFAATLERLVRDCGAVPALETLVCATTHCMYFPTRKPASHTDVQDIISWTPFCEAVRMSSLQRVEVVIHNHDPNSCAVRREVFESVLSKVGAPNTIVVRDEYPFLTLAAFDGSHPIP
ncbi:hypothetical protein C8F01DRAFT_178675 [Mycena amicta]|nr:hypothetical protein C8F01DRAFT_178675 [Mycena amicta]